MATRDIVPRADGEGEIGTTEKMWLGGHFKTLYTQRIENDGSGDTPDYCLSSYASWADAISTIGSTVARLIVDEDATVSADSTVPSTLMIKMLPGCVITIATTKTLTINGSFEAGSGQVFSCEGTGKVAGLKDWTLEMVGAVGDGSTDDWAKFVNVIDSINATGYGVLTLAKKTYLIAPSYASYTASKRFSTLTSLRISGDTTVIKIDSGLTITSSNMSAYGFIFDHCDNVDLSGSVEIDGQNELQTYSPTSAEGGALGLGFYACEHVVIGNGWYVHNMGSDGLYIADNALAPGTDNSANFIVSGRFTENRRHSITLASVDGLVGIGTEFSTGGHVVGGGADLTFGSGMDIEPAATMVGVNNVVFISPKSADSTRANVIAASNQNLVRNVMFIEPNFSNTLNQSVVLSNREISIYGGKILGEVSGYFKIAKGTNFYIDDTCGSSARALTLSDDYPTCVEDFQVFINTTTDIRAMYVSGSTTIGNRKNISRGTVTVNGNAIPDNAYVAFFGDYVKTDDVVFLHTGTAPATKYTVTMQGNVISNNCKGDNVIKRTTTEEIYMGIMEDANQIPTYADNAAATAAGLDPGRKYKTATGIIMVVY